MRKSTKSINRQLADYYGFCPPDYYDWDPGLTYTTPEGVELEICICGRYVGTFYRRRLIAYVSYLANVRRVRDRGDGVFYVEDPWSSEIRVHFDHIEYIYGWYDEIVEVEPDFLPPEVIDYRERRAREAAEQAEAERRARELAQAQASERAAAEERARQLALAEAMRQARADTIAEAARRRDDIRRRAVRWLRHIIEPRCHISTSLQRPHIAVRIIGPKPREPTLSLDPLSFNTLRNKSPP